MANTVKMKRSAVPSKVPTTADLDLGEVAINTYDGKMYIKKDDGTASIVQVGAGGSGSGNVVGPASATDNAVVRFDGTTGELIQNSNATLSDAGTLNVLNINTDYVQIDTLATPPTIVEGTLAWNDGEGTADLGLKGGNVSYQLGEQEFARVYNDQGSTLTIGQAVYLSGSQGNRIAVKLAQADSELTSRATIGLVAETIAAGAEGWVQVSGKLPKLNTNGFTAGAPLYLSATIAGAYTSTRPPAPAHTVILGWLERASTTVGSIYIKVDNGYELDELHNVVISSPSNGNTLIYDATNGTWINSTIQGGTGISITPSAGGVSVANTGVISVAGTSPVASSGGANPTISLDVNYGDTQNPYAIKTQNTFLAAPSDANGIPSFRAVVAADIPILNQNTTGTAANITANTNNTLETLSLLNLPYSQLIGTVPTWNQNTTGTAANITAITNSTLTSLPNLSLASTQISGNVPVNHGGTGADNAADARLNLSAAKTGANTDITSIALTSGTISTAPASSNDIVNKSYADSLVAGVNFHAACNYATTAALSSNTYNNGSSGVGATITSNTNGALFIDGYSPTVGQRILIKNESTQANNGVYTVTQVGNGSTPYILTRATDFNTAGSGVNQIDAGDLFLVISGTTNANTSWVQQTPLPITVGTTAIVFTQFAAVQTYTAGTGLSLVTNQFSIANTGTAGTYGSASSVPVFVTNAQGQVTSVTNTPIQIAGSAVTGDIAGNAATATTATTATNLAGGTMGRIPYQTAAGTTAFVTPNNTNVLRFLRQIGDGTTPFAPAWSIIQATDLPDTAVTAGSYTNANITVDAQGRLTAASSGASGGVTSITGTANQIIVTGTTTPTLSTPQNIGTTSSVQFGSFGIGTAASGTTGEIRATNNVTAYYTSDKKFKENIRAIPSALPKVLKIGGKLFDWTDEYIADHGGEDGYFVRKSDFGVIAQDVQEVFEVAVRTKEDGTLAVDYEKMCALAFAAIKELNQRILELELKVK